jgi:hypothetical protein
MDDFWTDTPFGITVLTGLLTTIAAGVIVAIRLRKNEQLNSNGLWVTFIVRLGVYAFAVMIFSYTCILIYWFLVGTLTQVLNIFSLDAVFEQIMRVIMWITPLIIWFFLVLFCFLRMFRQWL